MGLDMWFREDVVRILASTAEVLGNANERLEPLGVQLAAEYQAGFLDALKAVAVGFGVRAPSERPRKVERIESPR